MPVADERAIRGLLEPGEELLWWGRPLQGLRVDQAGRWFGFFLLMFGTPVLIAALVGGLNEGRRTGEYSGGLLAVGFLLAIALLAIYGMIEDIYVRRNTLYGLTRQWAIIANRKTRDQPRRLPIDAMRSVGVHRLGDGAATFSFIFDTPHWLRNAESGRPVSRPLFCQIEDPVPVFACLAALRPDLLDRSIELSCNDDQYLDALLDPGEMAAGTDDRSPH
jgi:hypothetical protein